MTKLIGNFVHGDKAVVVGSFSKVETGQVKEELVSTPFLAAFIRFLPTPMPRHPTGTCCATGKSWLKQAVSFVQVEEWLHDIVWRFGSGSPQPSSYA